VADSPVIKARIGLLMATRNQADLLPVALDSILGQSHRQLTLTVIDDGSTDATPEILARYSDPRLKVFTTKPQGQIPSLNLAMQKGKPAAFYGVVQASCFYAFNYLESMLSSLMRQPRSSGIFCCYCLGNSRLVSTLYEEPFFDSNELLVRQTLGPGVLFRGEAFKQAGGLFLSERKGIWETWQRLAAQGPFQKFHSILVRFQPSAYDTPPISPVLDPEKDLYPHLKTRILHLPGDTVDPDWLKLLNDAGQTLMSPEQSKERPNLVLCGDLRQLPQALKQAYDHYAPLMLVVNEPEPIQALSQNPQLRFLLGSATIATRTLKAAQQIQSHKNQALVYMHGMTKRETNRLLTRVPMLLYRQRAVIVIRAYGHPRGLIKTLNALNTLNHPPDFADVIILCLDNHPELIKWLQTHHYAWYMATQYAYYPELLYLLRQFKASFVLSLDAGVLPAADYYTKLWPLLSDPKVGMAAGLINQGPAFQSLPLQVKHPGELMQAWSQYKPRVPVEDVDRLSDNAILMRKTIFEWALESFPQTRPLSDETLFSRLLIRSGYRCRLSRQTVAFNLLETL
jgi:hypothetical protein